MPRLQVGLSVTPVLQFRHKPHTKCILCLSCGIAQPVQRLTRDWTVRGFNPVRGWNFFDPSRLTLVPTRTPVQWVPALFAPLKPVVAWRSAHTPSSASVEHGQTLNFTSASVSGNLDLCPPCGIWSGIWFFKYPVLVLSDFITVLRLVEFSTSVTFNGFYNSFGACVRACRFCWQELCFITCRWEFENLK